MKNEAPTALQKLAREVSAMFEIKTRDNDETFWVLKNGSPEWVRDICREAHSGMFPDDIKYELIVKALEALENYDDPDRISDEIEADPYNSDRLKWLASNLTRAEYVNDAVSEFGIDSKKFDLFAAIGFGQSQEKCEVLDIVRRALEDKIKAQEA